MARVLGDAGRYVTQQAINKRLQLTMAGMIVIAVTSTIAGFFAGFSIFGDKPALVTSSLMLLTVPGVIWLVGKLGEGKLTKIERSA